MRYFLLVLLCSAALAQTTATIVGSVTDSSGAVVPNTKITAIHKATGVTRVHGDQPERQLRPARCCRSASTTSPRNPPASRRRPSPASSSRSTRSRASISSSKSAQSPKPSTSAARPLLLQTENAVVGHVVDNRYTTQIPLNGRDFAQLVLLVPGTATRPGGFDQTVGSATGSLGSGVAIGGRDNQNNFTLDGAGNNARQFGNIAIKPSVDSIQEFKVQTNSYSAEMGQAAFGQISLITKSGTNGLHGSLFEFWRNDVFDARNFFLPNAEPAQPQSVRRLGRRPHRPQSQLSSSSTTRAIASAAASKCCAPSPFRHGAMAIFPA